jgi:hypothetical protein
MAFTIAFLAHVRDIAFATALHTYVGGMAFLITFLIYVRDSAFASALQTYV